MRSGQSQLQAASHILRCLSLGGLLDNKAEGTTKSSSIGRVQGHTIRHSERPANAARGVVVGFVGGLLALAKIELGVTNRPSKAEPTVGGLVLSIDSGGLVAVCLE